MLASAATEFGPAARADYLGRMVLIRSCDQRDFLPVYRLLRELRPDAVLDMGLLEDAYFRGLHLPGQQFLCAETEGRVVGFCSLAVRNSLWQQGFVAHVDELIVHADYQSQGVGTLLLEMASELATSLGCRRIELGSAFHRTGAHRFYEERGFENRAFLFSRQL